MRGMSLCSDQLLYISDGPLWLAAVPRCELVEIVAGGAKISLNLIVGVVELEAVVRLEFLVGCMEVWCWVPALRASLPAFRSAP